MRIQFNRFVKNGVIVCTLLLMSQASWATHGGGKTIAKARSAVDQAAPDDWYTLAEAAQQCFKQGVNFQQAVIWLNRSIFIKRTPYNLEIRGDYYAASLLPRKALEAYSESYRIGILTRVDYQGSDICNKMARQVIKLAGSYDGFLQGSSLDTFGPSPTSNTFHQQSKK